MDRRGFLKVISGGAAVAIAPSLITETLFAEDGRLYKAYNKVALVDSEGKPLKASALQKETNYIFAYPFAGTPVLLVDLGEATQKDVKLKDEKGQEYIFKGGVGKNGSIVAVSAICQHNLTHPNREESFFSYVKKGQKCTASKTGGVFVCSSHMSVYDPKAGSKVIAGPAPQPLANIILEIDKDDNLYAAGVLGSDKFHDYFKAFKREFKKSFGQWRKAKEEVKDKTEVSLLKDYTKDIIVY